MSNDYVIKVSGVEDNGTNKEFMCNAEDGVFAAALPSSQRRMMDGWL